MLDYSDSIQTIRTLQQGISSAHSLEGLGAVADSFGQLHLGSRIDIVHSSVEASVTALELPLDQTGYSLHFTRSQPFNDDEKGLAGTLAALIASSQVLSAVSQPSTSQVQLLQQISRAVVGEQQFQTITAVLAEGFPKAMPNASGRLLLRKQQSGELVVQSLMGGAEELANLAPVVAEEDFAQVIESAQTAVFPDDFPPQLIAPAIVKNKVVALLQIFYPIATDIPPRDITFFELVVGYLSIALGNARLLGQAWQRADQLETIYRITESALALQPLESTLTGIQERLMSAFNASICYVALHDVKTQTISFPWIISHKKRLEQESISILKDDSLVTQVVVNNKPFVTSDCWSEPTAVKDIPVLGEPSRSIICVPLREGNEVLGALSIQNDAPNSFDTAEFKTFMAVAAHIAIIIQNARLYDKSQTLVDQGTRDYQTAVTLRQAVARISTSLEPETVLSQLLDTLSNVIPYDTAYACLYHDQKLRCIASRDSFDRPLSAADEDVELAWSENSLFNEILRTKDAISLADVTNEPRWPQIPGNESVRAWLGVPLIAQQEILGMLLVNSHKANTFANYEKWLAQTLCQHTAVVLKNASLYKQAQQELSELRTLHQASATMTANLDQDFVLQTVVSEMVRALKVDSCTIFVWEENQQIFSPAAHRTILYKDRKNQEEPIGNIGLKNVEQLVKHPALRQIFDNHEIYRLRSDKINTPDESALLNVAGMQSILLVPLTRRNKMLGILALGQLSQPRDFHQSELSLAQDLAGQAAIAIEHAHLFSQAQRRIEELSTFHNIVLQLNTPLQLKSVLDSITEAALNLVDEANNLHIYLYDAKTEEYTFGSALWRDGRREPAVKALRPNGLTATVVQSGKSIVIDDAAAHTLFQSKEASSWGVHAIAGFPLKHSDQVIGAFTITYVEPHTFSDDELLLLNLLADQAAVAVKNAHLFDESNRRLRDMSALVDMAKQVTGNLKLRSVLQTTVQILQVLLNARASTITMLSDDGKELIVAAATGINPEFLGKARMKLGEGISGEVVQKRKLVYISDAHIEPNFLFFSDVVRSLLVVPLIVRDAVIGTLTVDSDQPNAFSESDIQLMTIAAAQASVAIANAHLFEEVEERAAELAVAYEELKESDRLKDELVQNVSHELRTPLTFVKGYVDLLMDGEMGLLNKEQAETLEIVSTKADEITRLIEDIITLQRIDAGNLQLEIMSLTDFLKTAVSSHQIVAGHKGLHIVFKQPTTNALVKMDKDRISQVVDNLIGNAMKFSPDGGTISVSLAEREKDILVTIKDEGIGVPQEKQQKIFERFYQVDGSSRRRFGGTGIGLAIVKRIVDAHRGKIWVESKVNKGSIFYFTLPRAIETKTVETIPNFA